jgi:hypothetical protein
MSRIARILIAALLLGMAGWWTGPQRASACSCAYPPDHPELVRIADVIFVGTVVGDRTVDNTRTYTFAVDLVYKGQAYATQTVITHAQGPACGLQLSQPGPYVVHARVMPALAGGVQANACGGTRPGGPSADLGEAYPPITGGGMPNDPQSLLGPAVILVVVGAAFAFSALAWRRRLADPDS